MIERKGFDIGKYFFEKYNIQGEIAVEVDGLGDFYARMVHYYGMEMPVTFNAEYINEGDIKFRYLTITDGNQTLIFPHIIEIPTEDPEWDDPYTINCYYYNEELNEKYVHLTDMDRIIILDRKVILLEKWEYYEEEGKVIRGWTDDHVLELGILTESDWDELKLIGKAKNVVIDQEEQELYKKICDKNNK